MSKVLCIIQARLNSQRFPLKVLQQIPPGSGVSMLELVIRKVCLAKLVDKVVVTTPDRFITVLCNRWNIPAYYWAFKKRDVVREYYETANIENAYYDNAVIVRITADSPMIRPDIIDEIVEVYLEKKPGIVYNTDCLSGNMLNDGYDVECFSYAALEQAYKYAEGVEREHVTTYIRKNLSTYYVNIPNKTGISVNTEQDYRRVCEMIQECRTRIQK